ncbi:DsbC family protein [Povalibacter sp.]|uniref:DsbC family protein n=1 Tax=Povalibacter sp. TaxID=1962978 RepID=UPI002F42B667
MSKLISHVCALVLFAVSTAVLAADTDKAAEARTAIAAKFPGVKPDQIKQSPVPGVYEVGMGADTAYVSADGKFLFSGDLYEVESRTNLTEAGRAVSRGKTLAKLDEREMIVFGPAAAKHTITIFTDVECGYCRKLHGEIDQLNKLGVRVRYLAYPRAGPGTDDWAKMEAVWCSKDRNSAITKAKQGQPVDAKCAANPVARQFELGEEMGVRGTPAIFTTSGDYIGGYLPPKDMLRELDQLKAGVAKTK